MSSGNTLKANDLVVVEDILPISARLIVNPAALKLKRDVVQPLLDAMATAVAARRSAAGMTEPALALRRLDADARRISIASSPALTAFESAQDPAVDATVAQIVADVRARGDAALLEYTAQFDGVRAASVAELEISGAEMRRAFESLPRRERDGAADRGGAHPRVPRAAEARLVVVSRSGRQRIRPAGHARSTASASTCPAARRRIRRRC